MKTVTIIFLFCQSLFASSDANIIIFPEAFVQGPTIRLYEIAKFQNMSRQQLAKIKDIDLADAPQFSEVLSFSSEAIAEMLRSKLNDNNLKFEIPSNISIKNLASKISADSVRSRIINGVRSSCEDCKIELRDVAVPPVRETSVKTTWDISADWSRVRGAFQLPLEVTNSAGKKDIYWVTGKALLNRRVLVTKRNLLFGEKIQKDDVELQNRDVTYSTDTVTQPGEVVGAIANTVIPANTLLTRSKFQRPPALKRGQDVTVRMGDSGWNVSIKGVAEQNGKLGDMVKVLNPLTKKVVVGTVVADGVVEVR